MSTTRITPPDHPNATEPESCLREACSANSEAVRILGLLLRVFFIVAMAGFVGLLWLWEIYKGTASNATLVTIVTFEHVFGSILLLTTSGFATYFVSTPKSPMNRRRDEDGAAVVPGITSTDACIRRKCHQERLLLRNWTVLFALALMCGLGGLAWIVITWHGELTAGKLGTFFGFLSGGLLGFVMKMQARQIANATRGSIDLDE